MNSLIKVLAKSGFLRRDLDYYLVRASMTQRFVDWVYTFGYPTLK
jgi:hypothetical protein